MTSPPNSSVRTTWCGLLIRWGGNRNRPVNLSFIADTIGKRVASGRSNIVFLDVFDLLNMYHPFYEVNRAFEQIKSICIEKNAYFINAISREAMDPIQFGQVTRFAQPWDPDEIRELDLESDE
ncbi:DUF835 domain-containing protein [Thermogymnomonas acidicola]|uniref:DUF835 domain-containing protein n=1 Tax=Thermogymnomonas acidicola TaxID=399579 RepID=UPI0013969FE4|nr:DUF835 domain-containing protein [Thermogymnomonas acidicola]